MLLNSVHLHKKFEFWYQTLYTMAYTVSHSHVGTVLFLSVSVSVSFTLPVYLNQIPVDSIELSLNHENVSRLK